MSNTEFVGKRKHRGYVTYMQVRQPWILIWMQTDRELSMEIEAVMLEMYEMRAKMILEKKTEVYPSLSAITDPSVLHMGRMCVAINMEGYFHRVRFISWDHHKNRVRVYYMDHGQTRLIDPASLLLVKRGFPRLLVPDTCKMFHVDGIDTPRNGGWKAELILELMRFTKSKFMDFHFIEHDKVQKGKVEADRKYIELFYEHKNFNVYVRRAALGFAQIRHDRVTENRKSILENMVPVPVTVDKKPVEDLEKKTVEVPKKKQGKAKKGKGKSA